MNAPKIREMLMQLKAQLFALETELLAPPDPTADQMDITGGEVRIPSRGAGCNYTAPGAWSYVKLEDNYRNLLSIIGSGKIRNETDYLPWGRLIAKWGWVNVLKGAEATEPSKRWSADVEQTIVNKKRSKESMY